MTFPDETSGHIIVKAPILDKENVRAVHVSEGAIRAAWLLRERETGNTSDYRSHSQIINRYQKRIDARTLWVRQTLYVESFIVKQKFRSVLPRHIVRANASIKEKVLPTD